MSLADAVVRAVVDRTPFVDPAVETALVAENIVLVGVRDRDPRHGGPAVAAGVAHRPPGSAPAPAVPRGTDAFDVGRWTTDPPDRGPAPRNPGDRVPDSGDPDDLGLVGPGDPDADGPDDLGSDGPDELVARSLGLATLNALSAPAVDWRPGDPFETLVTDGGTVATVGLFRPALRKFGATTVRVIELEPVDPSGPPGVTVESHVADGPERVPGDVERILRGVDVLFVTGSALIYGGIDRYLAAADPDSTVVLVGATASFVPGPAFEAGVDVLAGARVTDPDAVARAAGGGACATDLHGEGIEKVFVTADGRDSGIDPV